MKEGVVFKTENLCARYGSFVALQDINISIQRNEFVSLIGPNGSGKTTLLSLLCSTLKPSEGRIIFINKELSLYSQKECAQKRSAAFLHKGELPAFTVREFLEQRSYCRSTFLNNTIDESENISYAVDVTGIAALLDKNINTLSSGEFQLVSIAGAVVQSRQIILLDEPASHLDLSHARDLYSLLARLHSEGSTIIAVFHDINAALNLSDRIIALQKGSVVFNGNPESFRSSNAADAIFGVTSQTATNPVTGSPHLFFN
jgi:ABC-type cobalamin/Fe3+-siderophores transport system ATPase subunit